MADGLLTIAEGTDGGGSVMIPASWCGVYGYKASFGRVPQLSRPNAFGPTEPFLFEGTLTRSVEDAALALTALSGYHPADPFSIDEDLDFTAALRASLRGKRIAYSPDFDVYDVYPVDPRVAAVVADAVRAFEQAGAHVDEISLGIERAGLVDGLPVGMQIIGRRYADIDVLAASATFERLRPWHDTYQPAQRQAADLGGWARQKRRYTA